MLFAYDYLQAVLHDLSAVKLGALQHAGGGVTSWSICQLKYIPADLTIKARV